MLSLLKQLKIKEDDVSILVGHEWFEGVIIQLDSEILILRSIVGVNGSFFSNVIRIDSINVLQFTTDFRPTKHGVLCASEIEEI